MPAGRLVRALFDRSRSTSAVSLLKMPDGRLVRALPSSLKNASAVSGSKIPAGSSVRAFLSSINAFRLVSPAKSPGLRLLMSCDVTSNVPLRLARCAGVTSAHVVAGVAATMALRTCAVRAQMPPDHVVAWSISEGMPGPSTLRAETR